MEDKIANEKGMGSSTSTEKITSIVDHNESVIPFVLKYHDVNETCTTISNSSR